MNERDRKELAEIKTIMERVERGLYGEDENNTPGALARIERLEQYFDKLTSAKTYGAGIIAVIVFLATLLYGLSQIADTVWKIITGNQ